MSNPTIYIFHELSMSGPELLESTHYDAKGPELTFLLDDKKKILSLYEHFGIDVNVEVRVYREGMQTVIGRLILHTMEWTKDHVKCRLGDLILK